MVQDLKRNYLQENCKMKSTSPLLKLEWQKRQNGCILRAKSFKCNFTHNVRNLCYVD